MGIQSNLLSQLLSSHARAEIFRLLFNGDQSSSYLRDLQRQSGLSIGTIQKEIANLKKLDLIVARKDGNRLYFIANIEHPLYREICGLVEKTSGIVERLRERLLQLKGIECAFIFGSFAKGREKSHSDIDLIIIGDVGLRSLSSLFKELTNKTQREINPHIFSLKSWKDKLKNKDHFIRTVFREKKIFLVGDENVIS
ncbi:MAG: nucleotidyltransferase domain-containing protein [Bdellovibrionaceae bacterium]|nr:nucleotidyltransferase domain-containing protein [Pseudobdellovibrionaceae bacterium]